MQMSRTANILNNGCPDPPGWARETLKKREEPTAEATPRWSSNNDRSDEPAYKLLIRCLNDVDNLLDTVKDPASFEAVKPRILRRVRQHKEVGQSHPEQGMTQLSKSAAAEFEKAIKRHAASVIRAESVAPAVTDFFKNEVRPVMEAK
jgi:hypothetical protein